MRAGGWLSWVTGCGFLALWEVAARLEWINPVLTSAPSRILTAATALADPGALAADLLFTLRVFGLSLGLAGVGGVLLGFAVGLSPALQRAAYPFLATLNALPKIVLMPLLVLWLGIGMKAGVALSTLMAGFPILTAVSAGARSLDADYVRLGRAFGAGRWLLWRAILLPGVAPYALAGLRVAVSYGMVGALIAEFFASSRGVGYRMVLYMANFQVDAFFLCIVLVAAFTLGCTALVQALERRVEGWRPSAFEVPGL
jgi:NitT/TauT family transport system permease protein